MPLPSIRSLFGSAPRPAGKESTPSQVSSSPQTLPSQIAPQSESAPPPPSNGHPSSSSLTELSSSQFEVEERDHVTKQKLAGKRVIRSSDDEDSDSDLEDLDTILGFPSTKKTYVPENTIRVVPPPLPPSKPRSNAAASKILPPKAGSLMGDILKRRQEEQEAKARLEQERADFALENPDVDMDEPLDTRSVLEKANMLLAADQVKKSDDERSEEEDRDLYGALLRTEADKMVTGWYFFNQTKEVPWESMVNFPPICGNRGDWEQRLIADPELRENGGIPISQKPEDFSSQEQDANMLTLWMIFEVCFETNERLRDAYMYAISKRRGSISALLSAEIIASMFLRLGGGTHATSVEEKIQPVPEDKSRYLDKPWDRLYAVIDLLSDLSINLVDSTKQFALLVLCRLSLDSEISLDPWASYSIESAISNIISSFSEAKAEKGLNEVAKILIETVQHPALFVRLLENLPTTTEQSLHHPTSSQSFQSHDPSRVANFRRTLALRYFFSSSNLTKPSLPNPLPISIPSITARLKQSSFTIGRAADYAWMHSMIQILEHGLDDGDAPAPSSSPGTINTFNAAVDDLAAQVRYMSGKIHDTGFMHMARTETKDALDRLHFRLTYATRTKPRKKKDMFSWEGKKDVGEEGKKQREFMSGFLGGEKGTKGVKRKSDGKVKD